jgi:mevalonate kinase
MNDKHGSDSLKLLTNLAILEKQASEAAACLLSDSGPIPAIVMDDLLTLMQAADYEDSELKLMLLNQLLLATLAYERQQQETIANAGDRLNVKGSKTSEYARLLRAYLEREPSQMIPYLEVYE